ncbi:MAG: hypothetical protein IJM35_03495 [Bacteroidales bacterium]|nr:hypothetical protein [Bacteroidales bacterium]
MKKTNYILWIAGAVMMLSAVSCARPEMDAPETVKPSAGMTFRLGIPDVKTSLGPSENQSRKVFWSNGDKVAINGIESVALSNLPDNATTADFMLPPDTQEPAAPYKIIYPSAIYKDASTVTLPAVQTWKSGTFADGMFPMAGYSEEGFDAGMKYLCATLKISVKLASGDNPDTDKITLVTFKGKGGEQVSGDFTVDYENATLTGASQADADKSVSVSLNQALSSTALDIFVVVPAGTYSGFTVTVQDAKGHTMEKNLNHNQELVAGKLYNLPEFAFVPTGEATGIEIWNAEQLIKFAEDYNSGALADYPGGLIATVMDDIDFDAECTSYENASVAFNATGGIGTDDDGNGGTNYFNGIFNGNNHTISNLAATVPVFAYTGGNGIIQDLTLDSSCSLTVNTSSGVIHGVLIGRHKGLVQNCTSSVSVTINNIQDVSVNAQHYGGLVGYVHEGTIKDCSVTGSITCSQTGQTISANEAYIGGIAGRITPSGIINTCSFTGNITISDGTNYGGITADSKNFYIGGVLGRGEKAIISGCDAGKDGISTAIDARGTFIPAVGGIVGWLAQATDSEIRNCNNYMSLSVSNNGARANTTPCRIGGIAARSAAYITGCTNNGALSSVSNSTTLNLGGIVADGVNVSNCTNNAGGTITRSNASAAVGQTNRYMYIGGIMGLPNASGDIVDCTNHAAITSNILGTATQTTIDMGGIVGGGNASQIDISGCVNDGEIKLDNDNEAAVATARNAIGGILGNASQAGTTVSGCSNSGKVWCKNNAAGTYGNIQIGGGIGHTAAETSVTDCTNSGEIMCQNPGAAISAYVDLGGIVGCAEASITISGTAEDATLNSGPVTVVQASSNVAYARNTLGGILGYGKGDNTKINNCKNTAKIYCNLSGTLANGRPSYTGGIVGLLASLSYTDNAASGLSGLSGAEIGHCNNTGEVNSANYNNRAGNKNSPFAGGIAGLVCGNSESRASIHDCIVGTQTAYFYRGVGGGLIAYANNCTIEDNTTSANMSGANANVNGVGGIVGRLFDSSMNNCTFSGKIARAKNIGGLVYTLSEQATGSTITECKVNGAVLTTGTASDKTAAAVLVSITDDKTNTITNCGVKGTLDGAAITLSSNMITTDGGATVTGTYLLD